MPARLPPCFGAPHMSGPQLDRDADERAVLGPGAVVVLDVLLPEQLAEHEPGVAGALADPAVGDGVLAGVQAGVGVEGAELLVALERAVLVGRLAPGHVDRARDVPGALGALLRQVRGGDELAGELVGRADVDQVLLADRVHDLVAERADGGVLLAGLVLAGRPGDGVGGQRAAVELPLLAAAVDELDVGVAVQLEVPVGVGGEPVVVAAVEDHGVVVADAALGQQLLELLAADEVAARRVLQVLLPVQLDRALDVALVVGAGVLVDLDEDDAGLAEMLLGPVGGDEHVVAAHGGFLRWWGVLTSQAVRAGTARRTIRYSSQPRQKPVAAWSSAATSASPVATAPVTGEPSR